jgi:hypothetical protein
LYLTKYQIALRYFLLLFTEVLRIAELRNGNYLEGHIMADTLRIIFNAGNEMLVYCLSDEN